MSNILTTFTDISNDLSTKVAQADMVTSSASVNLLRNAMFEKIENGQINNMWGWNITGPLAQWAGNTLTHSMALQPGSAGVGTLYQDLPLDNVLLTGKPVTFTLSFATCLQSNVKSAYAEILMIKTSDSSIISKQQVFYGTPAEYGFSSAGMTPVSGSWTYEPSMNPNEDFFIRIVFGHNGCSNSDLNNGNYIIMYPKFEIGTVPTGFSVNPLDVQSTVDAENLIQDSATISSLTWGKGTGTGANTVLVCQGNAGTNQLQTNGQDTAIVITNNNEFIAPLTIDTSKFIVGETYTMSAEMQVINGVGSPGLTLCRTVNEGQIAEPIMKMNCSNWGGCYSVNGISIPNESTQWIKVSTTFKLTGYVGGGNFQSNGENGIRFEFTGLNTNANTTIYIRRMMLTKGSALLNWRPSPLDRQEYLQYWTNQQANDQGGGPMYYQKVDPANLYQEFSGMLFTNWSNAQKLVVAYPMAFTDTAYDLQVTALGNNNSQTAGTQVYSKEEGGFHMYVYGACAGYMWKASGRNNNLQVH